MNASELVAMAMRTFSGAVLSCARAETAEARRRLTLNRNAQIGFVSNTYGSLPQ
jgi:hypothetical protein